MKAETLAYLENRFEKIRRLRQTAKGEVWLATDPEGKPVVWKTINLTDLPYAAIKKLPHPLLPEVIHVAGDEESTIVIEEYVQGQPLSELVARKQFLREAEVRRILLQLCSGLALLHGKGIIHRDIKPSNLILQKNGDVRLIDFDAARVVKEDGEEDTRLLGTKGYAPPEQFGYGQTDARSDIYSLGVTLKKLLAPEYKGYLRRILDKCTEVDAKRRYDSMAALERAVRYGSRWQKLRWLVAGIAVLALGAALHLFQREPPPVQIPPPQEEIQEHTEESKAEEPIAAGEAPAEKDAAKKETAPPTEQPSPQKTHEPKTVETPKKQQPAQENTEEQPRSENRIYITIYGNGEVWWRGRNAFNIPINNMGKMLYIPKALWQTWDKPGGEGTQTVTFPADWSLELQVQNVSEQPWEHPSLELTYNDHGSIRSEVLHGETLQAGGSMDFSIPLGGYTVERPDIESPSRELKMNLSGDGPQEVFNNRYNVTFVFEQ